MKIIQNRDVDILFVDKIESISNRDSLVLHSPLDDFASKKLQFLLRINFRLLNTYIKRKYFKESLLLRSDFMNHNVVCTTNQLSNSQISGDLSLVIKSNQWLPLFDKYYKEGFRKFYILPDIIGPYRGALQFGDSRILFLPNYKVGYTSITALIKRLYPDTPAGQTGHVSKRIDFSDMVNKDVYSFSIYRDPIQRFLSLYKWIEKHKCDKTWDFAGYWYRPIEIITDEKLSIKSLAKLICEIPDTHADNHFVSQYHKTHFNEKPLVKYLFGVNEISKIASDLSEILNQTIDIPKANKTENSKFSIDTETRNILLSRYAMDNDIIKKRELNC